MSFAVTVAVTHQNWKLVVDNPTATVAHPLGLASRS